MAHPTNALIVDDESHVRTFLRLLLQEVGITNVWEAADGATGIALAQQHQPELILLDVNLPVMTGLEVLAKLQELEITSPVVMMTAQSSINTVSETMRLGAVGYILKQVPKDEAIESLREVFDNLDAEEE
ncbi:response regulator [Horticoccus sp. 23ND18S-11]|uniref:response regulator n=1 Tax=Horticoccus sp. 23ND18S-11 TaxID=3391832 RepID=UPI0039C900A3